MRKDMAPERDEMQDETREEQSLRATLHAHAAEVVDTQAGWEVVAPRLAQGARRARLRVVGRGSGGKRRMGWRQAALIAAAVAIVAGLVAAAASTPFWGGLFGGPKAQLIGDERLYTTIGQSQTHGGVTVTIDKVYADPGNTYISFTASMPDAMAKHYTRVIANHVTITDAAGNEARGLNSTCDPLSHDALFHHDGVEPCLMDVSPFQPPAGATTLTLNVEIGELWLFRTADGHQRDILTGPWRFTFSLPFHQQSLGPGGPYAQPATHTP
jgi:hypothetical protein